MHPSDRGPSRRCLQTLFEPIGEYQREANILPHLRGQAFGPIPDAIREQIEQADTDTLLRWSGLVVTQDSALFDCYPVHRKSLRNKW
jgi:hypothetical protein